jgi:transposase
MMMTAVLLYAYCSGVYSSRRIARAARERVDFMSIVGLDALAALSAAFRSAV